MRSSFPVVPTLAILWILATAPLLPAQDIEKARQEGVVVWYTNLNVDASQGIAQAFEKKFSPLKVRLYRAGNSALGARIMSEAQAGRTENDVTDMTLTFIGGLLQKNLVVPYNSPERRFFRDEFKDKESYWTGTTVQASVIGYNTRLVARQEAPKSYDDLLLPRWRGRKITMEAEAYEWFQAMLALKGREKTLEFIKNLRAQQPAFNRGRTLQAQLVAAGEYEVALELFNYRVEVLKNQGAPIDWVAPNPMVVNPSVVSLAARAPHPNAGKIFIDFLLSAENAALIRQAGRIPARSDVEPNPPRLLKGLPVWVPDPQDDINKVIALYNEAFGIGRK
ncbi:MAG TPA: extracellular solute-binding protein [Candidatus Binatia bacterium]|jgi:iron(III) transport system substrate-binding protein